MKKLALAAFGALSLLSLAALPAGAQNAPAAMSSAQAPAGRPALQPTSLTDTVVRYVVGPMGRARGVVLSHGTVVFTHAGRGQDLASLVPVGTTIRVDGMINPAAPQTVYHATLSNTAGAVLVQPPAFGRGPQGPMMQPGQPAPQGPMMQPGPQGTTGGWHGHRGQGGFGHREQLRARIEALPVLQVRGTVQSLLTGPRGHAHGALLSDGSTVYFRGPLAHAAAQHGLRVGDALTVQGHGTQGPQGSGLVATQLTFADGAVATLPPPPVAPQQ